MYFPSSGPTQFWAKLQTGVERRRQRALTRGERAEVAYFSDLSAVANGRSLLSTIAPDTPTPMLLRLSSVMVFWRNETIGMLQKSISDACSRTTLAILSAPSPVIPLNPTLHEMGVKRRRQRDLTVGKGHVIAY